MSYSVICYAVHDKRVASINSFATYADAQLCLERDSRNVYEEELSNSGNSADTITYSVFDDEAEVTSCDEYVWKWHIVNQLCHEKEDTNTDSKTAVETPVGTLRASTSPDTEYPGICILLDAPREPGVIVEYNPNVKKLQVRVYGMADPDGEPVAVVDL